MNKKILIGSVLAVFMLVAISFASAVSTQTTKVVERKDSPLFGIRTRRAIGEPSDDLKDNIKVSFIGEGVFDIPLSLGYGFMQRVTGDETQWPRETCKIITCYPTFNCGLCTDRPTFICGECTEQETCLGTCWPQDTCRLLTCKDTQCGHGETCAGSPTCWPQDTCRLLTCNPTFMCGPCTDQGATFICCDE